MLARLRDLDRDPADPRRAILVVNSPVRGIHLTGADPGQIGLLGDVTADQSHV